MSSFMHKFIRIIYVHSATLIGMGERYQLKLDEPHKHSLTLQNACLVHFFPIIQCRGYRQDKLIH